MLKSSTRVSLKLKSSLGTIVPDVPLLNVPGTEQVNNTVLFYLILANRIFIQLTSSRWRSVAYAIAYDT